MRAALLFGGSGQIGRPLLARLLQSGWTVTALSRQAHVDAPQLHWLRGDLQTLPSLATRFDAILSCGPLDHFARWYAQADIDCKRLVVFGSTSVETKRDSDDESERELAARLRAGEWDVFETAQRRGAQATVLRPTLVYGTGADRSLSQVAAHARRWGRFVLPRDATGLRQPVHVEDLAQAARDTIDNPASFGNGYALPGGETLSYRDMVERVLAVQPAPVRLHEVSPWVFSALLRTAQRLGVAREFGVAAQARMRQDLVFDIGPARRDFGYAPRAFAPTAEMFSEPQQAETT